MRRYFQPTTRREFLKTTSAAALATLASGLPRLAFGNEAKALLPATADQVILLWMAGGMAHTETFDPKEYIQYRTGLRQYALTSTFDKIDTVVDNIKFTTGLERIASVMDRGTLIRSFSPPDLGHILHSRHQYHWHTGYTPPQPTEVPHMGTFVTRTLGSMNHDVPAFVHIGQRLDIDGAPEVQAFLTPGFLGSEYGPLLVTYPETAMQSMSPALGMNMGRFENRFKAYKKLVSESPASEVASDFHRESIVRSMENGFRLLNSPSVKAFDLKLETEKTYNTYNTGRFGLGCLLARRLNEVGVRFVEVTTEHIPFGNWDTHTDGHKRTIEMKRWIDAPIAQLILDLEERGRLDRTLVIVASEFSRKSVKDPEQGKPDDPNMIIHRMRDFGMHRHFTKAGSVLLFGGGMKKGFLYGKTADEIPSHTIENPVTVRDLHATIYRALGIPADLNYVVEKRPFYVTEDGLGRPNKDILPV